MEGQSNGDLVALLFKWTVLQTKSPRTISKTQTFNETATLDHQNCRPFSC